MALLPRAVPRAIRQLSVNQDHLDRCVDIGNDRLARYRLFEGYYQGEHKVRLADRARRYLEASGLRFSENFCEPVIDVLAERCEVIGFTALIANDPAPPELSQWLDTVWQRNRADALQGVVHTTAFLKGDAFALVDWDAVADMPRVCFNRPDIVRPVYDDSGRLEYASKVWLTDTAGPQNMKGAAIQRLNVYYPDRVEKYYRPHSTQGAGGWERWADLLAGARTAEPWPVPWVAPDGEPLGVPVVHFRNQALGGTHGRSELRSLLPQQDALNKQIIDLHDILDNQAWPQRYVTGVEKDTTDLEHKPGQYLHTSAADAKFGQLDPADPMGVLAAIEQTISRIARRSRTPLHLLVGGDMPSGESLRAAEAGLVAKARRRQVDLGNSWEDVMVLAARLAAARGTLPGGVDMAQLTIESEWADPQSRSEQDDLAWVQAAAQAGASQHSMLLRLGLDPDEELEYLRTERATLDDAAGRLLDAGAGA